MTRAERAMQVWQILIGASHNRQTLTYRILANHLEFEGAGVFAQILGCIMSYCESNDLLPLTCLVVNQTTGLPGAGLTTVEDLPKDREAVYNHNWYAMQPVQVNDFAPFA
ncbi:hypothetical protein [Pseudomonas sp. Marseille-QA0892]